MAAGVPPGFRGEVPRGEPGGETAAGRDPVAHAAVEAEPELATQLASVEKQLIILQHEKIDEAAEAATAGGGGGGGRGGGKLGWRRQRGGVGAAAGEDLGTDGGARGGAAG